LFQGRLLTHRLLQAQPTQQHAVRFDRISGKKIKKHSRKLFEKVEETNLLKSSRIEANENHNSDGISSQA